MANVLLVIALGSCAVVLGAPDNKGKEFVLGFSLEDYNPTRNAFINITTSVKTDVKVTVTAPRNREVNLNENFVVRDGVVETVSISYKLRGNGTGENAKGVLVTATDEIIVHVSDGRSRTYSEFVGYPTDVLGHDYIFFSQHGIIVGLEDSTTIFLSNLRDDENFIFHENVDGTIVLNRFDTYQIPALYMHVYIRSEKNFAVFNRWKDSRAIRDFLPLETWGRKFICNSFSPPLFTSQSCAIFCYKHCNITCTNNENSWKKTNHTEWVSFGSNTNSPTYCETTEPAIADKGFRFNSATMGQLHQWYFIPPSEQFANKYEFIVNGGDQFVNYVIITIKQSELSGLNLDGAAFPTEWSCVNVTRTGDCQCQTLIDTGVHKIFHIKPNVIFGCMASGYSADTVYIRETGFRAAPINADCKPSLSVQADGIDNDCDSRIDEELCNGEDEDGDEAVDEDCASNAACTPTLCLNNGTCYRTNKALSCLCAADYTGMICGTALFNPGEAYVIPDEMYIDRKHAVIFRCQFTISDGFLYKVQWYHNSDLVTETSLLTANEARTSFVADDSIVAHGRAMLDMDLKIHCEVIVYRSFNSEVLEHSRSPQFRPVNIGIRSLEMATGEAASIPVELNIPFGCSLDSPECILQIQLSDPDNSYTDGTMTIAVKGHNTCGLELDKSSFDKRTKKAPYYSGNIVITTIKDIAFKREKRFYMKLRTNVIGSAKSYWSTDFRQPLILTVKDVIWRRRKYCYSHVDPHMCTFDQRYYENQNEEVFILFRCTQRNIEIQTKTKPCNRNRAMCSCSCTMKAGGDTFMINHCNQHKTQYLSDKDQSLKVYQKGDHFYRVLFPSGMVVNIRVFPGSYTMNIDVYPSPADINQGEGLCGIFNGDPSDDFILRGGSSTTDEFEFSMAWSLLSTNRRSEQLQYSYNILAQTASATDVMYCVCPNEQSSDNGEAICRPYKESLQDQLTRAGEKLLQIKAKPYINPEEIMPSSGSLGNSHVGKRQTSSLTFDEAMQLCIDEFQKCPVYEHKQEYSDIGVEQFVIECALDIQLTGDVEWAIPHCDALSDNFLMQIALDEEFKDSLDTELQQVIMNQTCPGRCGHHGTCLNGACVCDEGYGSELCYINLSIPPVLDNITFDGLCDKARGDDCSIITISGDGFTKNSTCKLAQEEADTDGYFGSMDVAIINCSQVNFNEIEIHRNIAVKRRVFAERIGISISNNGVNFSDFQYITIIDTTCQNLTQNENGTELVYLKSGHCYIDGACIKNGTVVGCNMCDSSVAEFSWTNVCQKDKVIGYQFFVLIGVGCFVALVLIVLLGCATENHVTIRLEEGLPTATI